MVISLNKSSYDIIANEYYDSRHITCRNFDEATLYFCKNIKHEFSIPQNGIVLEVGCGKGSVNRFFNVNLDRVIQADISLQMLNVYPRENSLCAIQSNAIELPFHAGSFAAVFAFLYDPYNVDYFYSEIERILVSGGVFVGTLPHFDWGSALRNELKINIDKTRFKR